MDDKKTNTNTPNTDTANKPAASTSGDKKVTINIGNPSNDNQKKEEPKITFESNFGATGAEDINKNLGSFGKTVNEPEKPAVEVKLDVDQNVVDKASKEKINFERFSKTRKTEKAAKTRFGEKVGIMLRSRKGLITTWVLELSIMFIVIAVSAILIGYFYQGWISKQMGAEGMGPLQDPVIQSCIKVGTVFLWISIFPCVIPLIYLVTAWFVGINQVASSRTYHYMFWICGLVMLVTFIVGFALSMTAVSQILAFNY